MGYIDELINSEPHGMATTHEQRESRWPDRCKKACAEVDALRLLVAAQRDALSNINMVLRAIPEMDTKKVVCVWEYWTEACNTAREALALTPDSLRDTTLVDKGEFLGMQMLRSSHERTIADLRTKIADLQLAGGVMERDYNRDLNAAAAKRAAVETELQAIYQTCEHVKMAMDTLSHVEIRNNLDSIQRAAHKSLSL